MTAGTVAPQRAGEPAGQAGFAQVLRAEWTKFRTVRGWVIGMAVAALVTVLFGVLAALGTQASCRGPGGRLACPSVPLGPGGEPVTDMFYFVHQPLTGDGSITARVIALTGIITYPQSNSSAIVPGVEPWSKAGIIIKENTRQGSAYASVMVTGRHGVRMQYNYTHDLAGRPGGVSAASPRWLRLTRSGDTLTGYESADGTHWSTVGAVTLAGLSSTVQTGLFVTSPGDVQVSQHVGGGSQVHFTQTRAVFDRVSLRGQASGAWRGEYMGAGPGGHHGGGHTDWERYHRPAGFEQSGGTFTVTGSGDIAPVVDSGSGIERTLIGALAGLIAVIVVATLYITAEYRRGLIRTTLAASPRRGQMLAAKAIVIGAVTFVTGLAATALAVPLGERILRANGNHIVPATALTELRVMAGTAALLAVAAVLALAAGAMLRRSAAAVAAVLVAIVLPYVLAVAAILPTGVSAWLLRLTPAAAFAIQQTLPHYPQVAFAYTPVNGYYPLAPWAGFAVLCGYAALALILAAFLLRKKDA
jgi:ABC-type transport system involved in multi-copper enzyme maturation permease subunit